MKKFFKSDKALLILPWLYTLTTIGYELMTVLVCQANIAVADIAAEIINIFLVFGIAISFVKHEKNVMKILFGAILMQRVLYSLNYAVTLYIEKIDVGIKAFSVIYFVLYALLFINHLVLGYGHKSNPSRVLFNKLVGIVIVIVVVAANVTNISIFSSVNVFKIIFAVLSEMAIVIEILCIETKVDAYKINREEAGWTEEKGYPKGYVHEYEKNK